MARIRCFVQAALLSGALAWQAPALAGESGREVELPRETSRVALNWKDVPRWSDLRERTLAERDSKTECNLEQAPDSAECRYAAWQAQLQGLRDRAPLEQIMTVQSTINRLPYVSDLQNWRMADRWSTPAEMFAKGGDCEDYALTKYFALRDLGFPEAAMKLAIVWDNQDDEQHAVLFVHSQGAVWILDSKFAAPMPASTFTARYRVIYALNGDGASFSPSALGARRGEGPRLTAGGRMLAFRTRPVRRATDAVATQVAALAPPVPVNAVEPVSLASLTMPLATPVLAPAPIWARALLAPVRFRAVKFWFAQEPALSLSATPGDQFILARSIGFHAVAVSGAR